MTAHKVTGFLGILPRTAEQLLPDLAAQKAENVILTSGEIRPMRKPYTVFAPPVDGAYYAAYRAYDGTTEQWRIWNKDVDVARGPLPTDVEQRYYWTGDVCPRYASFTDFSASSPVDYALGIPKPTLKPTVSATGGSGSNITRVYCVTYFNPNTGEESGQSPSSEPATFKIDDTWTISTFDPAPLNSGTYTGVFTTPSTVCTTPAAHFLRQYDTVTIGGADYVVSAVSALTFTVTGDVHTPTTWARKVAWNTSGMQQRLYRSAGTMASFQLVAERTAATSSWTDNLTDANILGDELISSAWEPPPADLMGVIALPNGTLAGFRNNELLYSEPYQPHAWLSDYRYTTESKIVGIASFGTAVVAATETRPYIADGVDPNAVTMTDVSNIWPCKSKRSVCSVGDGVVYATETGLALIGASGSRIFTNELFSPEEWRGYVPSSMDVKVIDSRIYIQFREEGAVERRMFRIDVGEAATLIELSSPYNALYADSLNGYLYFISDSIAQFDALYGTRADWIWKGKEIDLQNPVNFGALKIEWATDWSTEDISSAYAIYLAEVAANQAVIDAGINVGALGQAAFNEWPINGATELQAPTSLEQYVYYTLFDHNQAIFTTLVTSGDLIRLPSGYKTDNLTHQLAGNVRVKWLKIAETPAGLKSI